MCHLPVTRRVGRCARPAVPFCGASQRVSFFPSVPYLCRSLRRAGRAEIIRIALPRSVDITATSAPRIKPTVTYLRSPPLPGDENVHAAGSKNTSFASSKSMPCFVTFERRLLSSHSNASARAKGGSSSVRSPIPLSRHITLHGFEADVLLGDSPRLCDPAEHGEDCIYKRI